MNYIFYDKLISEKKNTLFFKIPFLFLFLLSNNFLFSQKQDNIWLFGSNSVNFNNYKGFAYGNTILDFTFGEPRIYYDSIMTLDFGGTDASICNVEGRLMLYTNGMYVQNGQHRPIPLLDTIAYSDYWENFNLKDYPVEGQDWKAGFAVMQGALILPWPDSADSYAVLYTIGYLADDDLILDRFSLAKVLINENYHSSVSYKDKLIRQEKFSPGKLQACKHANGRDWWIVNTTYDRQHINFYLFDPLGINFHHQIKVNEPDTTTAIELGHLYFSPEGDKMAIAESVDFDSIYISLYNFDRSSGALTTLMLDTMRNNRVYGTLAFSPSGDYLYTSNHFELFQYNLTVADLKKSKTKVGDYDGFVFKYNEFDPGVGTELGIMAHGPDGQIYIAPESSNRYLHTIEYPDEKGLESKLVQRKYMIPTSNHASIPNFPNFRLGPLDGSIADTLGLDNNPIAKFRYEQDTTDHLSVRFTDVSYFRPEKWSWDFGDNTTFDGKKPYWHSFPHNGTYNVCLTVSNENSSNTTCRLITIGPSSIDHELTMDKVVSIFPNPTDGYLLMTISEYIPEHGEVFIYDMQGRLAIKQKIYYGWNNIDMTALSQGTYLYKVTDKKIKIGEGKIVKI